MNRRTQRVSSQIRSILGRLILGKLADPRIDPARTSITRVEMPEDLLSAKVFVSVIGEDKDQKLALQALRHASGHLQELMMKQISLRHTPILHFEPDVRFKKTLRTLELIDRAMAEIRQKDQPASAGDDGADARVPRGAAGGDRDAESGPPARQPGGLDQTHP